MQSNKKFYRLRIFIVTLCIVIFAGSSGALLAIKFFVPNNFNTELEAAETYASSSQVSGKPEDTTYPTAYGRVYVYYDNTYINSVSITAPTITSTSSVWVYFTWSGTFTMGRSGYSWSSSAPTSFSGYLGVNHSTSSSTSRTEAYDNAKSGVDADYASNATFSRNGNNFSLTSGSIPRYFFSFASSNYAALVVRFTTSMSSSTYFTINSYTLYFDYNGGNGTTTSKTITYGNTIGSLPTATRADYKFLGWGWSSTATSYVSSSTSYNYAYNRTLYAIWQWDGYSLTYSVSDGGGGSIVGANTQYSKNASVTVSAVANEGYELEYWLLNDTKLTANPLTFTITQNSTLVAYFKEKPNVSVTFNDSSLATYTKTEVGSDLYVVVDPVDGYYINTIVLDGITFALEYYNAKLNGAGNAHRVEYTTRDSNNIVSFQFTFLFGVSEMVVNLIQSEAPTYQNPPSGGANIEGVATVATLGGEARVNGFDTTDESSLVHVSAVAYSGYAFTGWTSSNGADLSGYGMSANIPYREISGSIVTANFALLNQSVNDELNN